MTYDKVSRPQKKLKEDGMSLNTTKLKLFHLATEAPRELSSDC